MGRTFAKFERGQNPFGDNSESPATDLSRTAKVFRVSLDDNLLVLRLLYEAKWARADGMAGKVGAGVRGNNANGARNEIHAERSVRLAEMKDDRGVVGSFDGRDHAKGALLWGFVDGVPDELECRFDVGGSQHAAVMEANAAAEMEDVRERVGNRPGFGKGTVEIHLIVALQQPAEEKSIEALGLGIRGKARADVGVAGSC